MRHSPQKLRAHPKPGAAWWGFIRYLVHEENRPRLWEMSQIKNVLVERLFLKNAPYWTTSFGAEAYITVTVSFGSWLEPPAISRGGR